MRPGDDGDRQNGDPDDEWTDPPLPDEGEGAAGGRRVEWPSNGFRNAAWAGWLALAYALVTGASALLAGEVPRYPALVGLLGVGLLVGVHLGGGDPRVWR